MSRDVSKEIEFQNDIVAQMQANGWQLGKPELYDRATALYTADVLSFVKGTQPKQWQKFCKVYPQDSDTQFIKHLEEQLKKANPNAIDKELRSYGALGVLKNYTNYKLAYKLARKLAAVDEEVDSKKARVRLNRWVRLHDYNISQKVRVIVDQNPCDGAAPWTGESGGSSRKEAVRYKLAFDKHLAEEKSSIQVMVAFSGEGEFSEDDPDSAALLDQKFTGKNMNPGLKGREMRKAFDTMDYQIMLVANKFQTATRI